MDSVEVGDREVGGIAEERRVHLVFGRRAQLLPPRSSQIRTINTPFLFWHSVRVSYHLGQFSLHQSRFCRQYLAIEEFEMTWGASFLLVNVDGWEGVVDPVGESV